ncbi:MAG: hypothetical protein H0Z37_01600, partial [Firmicutes bacterium]|nr:hypothetical protein [Bacillota bacterium]
MPAAEAPGLQLVLDIGTHKILGLAVLVESGEVSVSAAAVRRHGSRAMRDGQVHDVPAVAATVRQVVRSLEETVGAKLTKASIAAAGRALRTARGRAEQIQSRPETCSGELEQQLEWQAVADAQGRLLTSLPGEQQRWGYYCIAHSRTGCWLDGDAIGRLAGQRGRQLAMEVLATFLPGTVVDSLEAVLREAGLEVNSLTLEPIAALEAVIPPTMRHLDLVLVDVGAGTSDIALTGGGTVQAYAMVPQAGDSITEAVSHGFLLDFPVADEVKRRASRGETVTVENVLGEPVTVDPAALAETIREATEQLADKIAGAICEWTAQKAPAAVLLVGGGSQTPGLAEGLAERLGLPKSRVAIRDRRAVRGVRGEVGLSGPEVVTALGIALRLARGREIPPIRVRVNGRPVSLFLPDRCTVREAARIAGIPLSHLVGSMGPGITVTVNGDVMVIPGSKGEAARIHVNGQPATLDTVLANQDDVELSTAARGEPPRQNGGDHRAPG